MATYDRVTPATLANYALVIDDPTTLEDASKLSEVDLQTRRFAYDFLITKFDSSTGKLKVDALDSASLDGLVRGSTSNAGTEREVMQGTISTVDMRDEAISSAKLADGSVSATKLATDAVTTTKILDNAVTADKIADNTITATQMAGDSVDATVLKDDATGVAGAVTTDHIRTGAVTSGKIAGAAVGADQLLLGSGEGQLLLTGANPYKFAVKAMSGDATIDKDGVITLASKQECELVERANNGTSAGASSAVTWNVRGVATAWIEAWRVPTSSFVTLGGSGKISLPTGTYVIEGSAPAYKAGKHICRLVRYNVSDVVQETFYGTAETCPAAAAITNRTHFKAKITVAAASDYLLLEHYTELAEATDGLGLASSSGGTYEIYATLQIRKVG